MHHYISECYIQTVYLESILYAFPRCQLYLQLTCCFRVIFNIPNCWFVWTWNVPDANYIYRYGAFNIFTTVHWLFTQILHSCHCKHFLNIKIVIFKAWMCHTTCSEPINNLKVQHLIANNLSNICILVLGNNTVASIMWYFCRIVILIHTQGSL